MVELLGDIVGTSGKSLSPPPNTVVWRYLWCPHARDKQKLLLSRPSARNLNGAISVNFQFWASCLVVPSENSTKPLPRPPRWSYGGIFGIYGRAENKRIGSKNVFFATERTAIVTARVDVRGNAPCSKNVGEGLWH